METGITKVNVEGKPQTIVIPSMPMFMQLDHHISLRVGRADGPEVRAPRRGEKPPRPLRWSAAAIRCRAGNAVSEESRARDVRKGSRAREGTGEKPWKRRRQRPLRALRS